MIEVKNVIFSYNSKEVLRNVNLWIERGEVVFLLGPNGSGKTTLLKCIAGILKAKGEVVVDGSNLWKLSRAEIAKIFGYVPQRGEISFLTVFDVILLGRKPYIRWEASEDDYRVAEETIKMFNLANLASRKLNELSGGEIQLVLIARAFAQRPRYILLDEPTNNLDIKNQISVIKILRKAVKETGVSAIITTHELNLAANFADRIVLIKDGGVFASGGIEVLSRENIKAVYGIDVEVVKMNKKVAILPGD
ncbi:ABC transporter ATP-binding protein [Methermicoccus shengliensis]|uniref:Cobalamin import ATP-binding protein BtuD n=1 Tax=Methermicoccus shengliensis TaxID=660064 RepID=A0A832VX15_9EURY|nr:ABC transporter ATP-binding protein [Methermicoccus shengliensis]KUK05124.1 MAG: Iron (III) ABC transporter, ATP-binding protein (HemV-1) [Euryarchaeota archaeon 55_53]KUK30690.1 MAG: Iron (III) ABC transporter, ATP-binding protein (HemV-1) [Methanosarcinales archeaon 56_1174]MDI3487284.1 iron complex transport system ATP-binding protein [Methanosarcinales archaeon]MDN5294641.1 iron complex transport system ATP-binding protein [Methanosarcinales archaeon]HIH69348.1 ABC transporter ATP-bindi